MSTSRLKASDRQQILKKLMSVLKKKYGGSVPRHNLNVLETLLFACCLENSTWEHGEAAFRRLMDSSGDLNIIRVSSVREIEVVLGDVDEAAWKALRIRDTLQYVFERFYAFDFESLRRKTMDAAEKELSRIRRLTPFVRLYTLQMSLDSHVVPLDDVQTEILRWLGFVEPETTSEKASEELRSSIRKPDAALLGHLLRQLGTDRKYRGTFRISKALINSGDMDPAEAVARLESHLKNPSAARKKVTRTRKKPASSKKPAPTAHKSAAAKSKSPARKVSRKKPAAKKTTRRPARKK
jgi:hypothetical protein